MEATADTTTGINPQVLLFMGENVYLMEKTLAKLKQDFIEKHGDLNITILEDEEEITAASITNAAKSSPFLGEKRLIIVKNFLKLGESEDQDKIEKFLEKLPETAILLFFENPNVETRKRPKSTLGKTLQKRAKVKAFDMPSPEELRTWMQNRLEKNNVTISGALAAQIIQDSGADMQTLANEIGKLALYCENRAVAQNDIDLLISKSYSATIFQFTDALNAKNPKQAIAKLHILIDMGEEILPILGMIARHFRLLILVKDLLENQKIPKHTIHGKITNYDPNIKPYPVKLAIDQCAKFTMEQMKEIYRLLVKLNLNMKNGKIPQAPNEKHMLMIELEKMIIQATCMR